MKKFLDGFMLVVFSVNTILLFIVLTYQVNEILEKRKTDEKVKSIDI